MAELVFRDPPSPKKQKRDWPFIVEQLKAKPGRWAPVDSHQSRPALATIASRIKHNLHGPFKNEGPFEAVVRESEEPGIYELFVRYLGHRDGLS